MGDRRERIRIHALVLDDAERTVAAVRRLRRDGYEIADVHSPFPLHGIDEAMGLGPTRLPLATAIAGTAGAILAVGFQAWVGLVDWPMNIGGKSDLALPALLPVTFEVAVLLAAVATVGGLIVRSGLAPRGDSWVRRLAAVTDDRFVILVREADGSFDRARFARATEEIGVERWVEGWRVT